MLLPILLLCFAAAAELRTQAVTFVNPPAWLKERAVERTVDRVQAFLEWDIRRVQAHWYTDEKAFGAVHGFGATVLAVARKKDQTLHFGPRVTAGNFDSVFGHELAHIILFQKYKDAIPKWLEEGLANRAGKRGKVDYGWLAAQPERDVTQLDHPFSGAADSGYHYTASTALIEMLASKCDLGDLLQLSVGKKLETYIANTCGIADINVEFRNWVRRKKGSRSP